MPYISSDKRVLIDSILDGIPPGEVIEAGDINYFITKLLLRTIPKRYKDYNELVGVLECCKLELYRRAVAEYENKKALEHGDVY